MNSNSDRPWLRRPAVAVWTFAAGLALLRLCLAVWLGACAAQALAQTAPYPSRPVRIVVPFPPGGNNDLVARMLADELGNLWKISVVVENRSGAGGTVGTGYAAKQVADGYTLALAGTSTNATAPSIYPHITYDPLRDFSYIAPLTFTPNVLLVNAKLPVTTVAELVAYGRANVGKLSYSSPGVGLTDHLMMELFLKEAGMSALHVPYKGSAEARIGIIAGDVQMTFGTISAALPQIRSGQLRPLAVSGRERSALLPDVPTVRETGIQGLVAYTWTGLTAPAGTPQEIVAKINRDVTSVLTRQDMRDKLAGLASVTMPMSPDEFRKFTAAEERRWGDIARHAGVKVE